MTLMLITQPLYDFYRTYPSHIYICRTSLILWENLQVYNIEGIVQQEKEHKNQGACQALGIV